MRKVEFAGPGRMQLAIQYMDESLRTAGISPNNSWCWADLRLILIDMSKDPDKYHAFFHRES